MSRYRKVEVQMWGDEKFRTLSRIPPCGQGLWFYLITGPHTGPIPGLFRAGRAALAEELGWNQKDFDKAFHELSGKGIAKADFDARLVWLPNGAKHNPPENPNVAKSWRSEFDILPQCSLKAEAERYLKGFLQGLGETYIAAFVEGPRKGRRKDSRESYRNQEQEQEQEQDIDPSRAEGSLGKGTGQAGQEQPGRVNGSALAWDDGEDGHAEGGRA